MALSLFKKVQPIDEPIPERGGRFVLRQAISLRVKKKENLQSLVQTINAPQDKLIAFSEGAENLDEAQLSAVAMYVFGNATYSGELDRLASAQRSRQRAWAWLQQPIIPTSRLGPIHHRSRLGLRLPRRHPRRGSSSRASLSGLRVGPEFKDLAVPPLPSAGASLEPSGPRGLGGRQHRALTTQSAIRHRPRQPSSRSPHPQNRPAPDRQCVRTLSRRNDLPVPPMSLPSGLLDPRCVLP